MAIFQVGNIGTIPNTEKLKYEISRLTGLAINTINLGRISGNSERKENIKYFTRELQEVSEKDDTGYIWVYSGFNYQSIDKNFNRMYLVFSKHEKYGWTASFVNTEFMIRKVYLDRLDSGIENKERINSEVVIAKPTIKSNTEPKSNFHLDLLELLLIKDSWTKKSIQEYIHATVSRAKRLENRGKTENIIINENKCRAVINCGLMDTYGREIYIAYNRITSADIELEIVSSKQELIRQGFNKKDIARELEPIVFWNNTKELIFEGELEDFDLQDTSSLIHILEERIERFPDNVRDLPLDVLYKKLVTSIEYAVVISKRDIRYIVPTYEIRYDRIQFLVPFHVNVSAGDIPELAIIICKQNDFWSPMTVIGREEAYYNAKCVNPYIDSWLKPNGGV